MCPCKSLRLVFGAHHHFSLVDGLWVSVSARGAAAPRAGVAEVYRQCCAREQSERCGAGCVSRLADASWRVSLVRKHSRHLLLRHTLRLNIIAYFVTWLPVVRASLGGRHGFAPAGYKKAFMFSAFAGPGRSAVGAPRSHPRPTRRRLPPFWLSWHLSIVQALRAVCLVSGLWPCLLCVPRPPWRPRHASRALALRWSARPPPRGSLSPAPGGVTAAQIRRHLRTRRFCWDKSRNSL